MTIARTRGNICALNSRAATLALVFLLSFFSLIAVPCFASQRIVLRSCSLPSDPLLSNVHDNSLELRLQVLSFDKLSKGLQYLRS